MNTSQKIFRAVLATTVAAGAFVVTTPAKTSAEGKSIVTSFPDVVEGAHYYEAVQDLTSREILRGFPDGTFQPAKSVTRGQAAKILALSLELDIENVEDPEFTDVSATDEYYKYIAALASKEIIKGYPDQTFKPGNPLTRAQMAKIINLGFELEEVDLTDTRFTDVKIGDEFAGYVQSLLNNEITTGTTPTTFSPYKFVTRGQMASFIYRSEAAVLPGAIEVEDFGANETGYTAGVGLAEGMTLADVETLSVSWMNNAGIVIGSGTLTDKLIEEAPEATQVSMPFDASFDYTADGYWDVKGKFTGEPTQVVFTVTFTNGKTVTAENERELSGNLVAQDFGFVSDDLYSAGVGFTEGKKISDVKKLTVEWYDVDGNRLGKGTMTDKMTEEYPNETQISMPFSPTFDYVADGFWKAAGKFNGEPVKVVFSVKFTNGKDATAENTREVVEVE